MGQLLSQLSDAWVALFNSEREVKVVIVGLNNSGKTTTLYQMHLGDVVATVPTLGSNFEEVQRGNVKFMCWDLGGQDSFRKTWATYFTKTNAVVLVVDSSEPTRFPVVKQELGNLLRNEDLSRSAFLVFANKQDVKGSLSAAEITSTLALHEIKDRPWHIQPCCALTGEGINEGLDWIAQNLVK